METGANVLALTVIEAAVRNSSLIQKRDALNTLIAGHVADRLYVPLLIHPYGNRQYIGLIDFS